MNLTLTLRCDSKQILLDLELLAKFAQRSEKLRLRLLDFGDLAAQIVCIDAESGFALGANEIGVRLQFSDSLLELVSAVRAGQFDGLVVEDVLHE